MQVTRDIQKVPNHPHAQNNHSCCTQFGLLALEFGVFSPIFGEFSSTQSIDRAMTNSSVQECSQSASRGLDRTRPSQMQDDLREAAIRLASQRSSNSFGPRLVWDDDNMDPRLRSVLSSTGTSSVPINEMARNGATSNKERITRILELALDLIEDDH